MIRVKAERDINVDGMILNPELHFLSWKQPPFAFVMLISPRYAGALEFIERTDRWSLS